MTFVPFEDRILVEYVEAEKQTAGGIYLPDGMENKLRKGVVLKVGSGASNPQTGVKMPMFIREGDIIQFMNFAGVEVEIDGKKYKVMKQTEVLGKLV